MVAIAAIALTSLGGSSSPEKTASSSSQTLTNTSAKHAKPHHRTSGKTAAKTVNPAETPVAVLNGTETTGLAHRISSNLQQSGYSQASALSGRPPGANEVTVVEYASGHQAEAEAVARSLSVAHVQPIEQAVGALSGTAKVVVIVGADKATTGP